jgi:hypothetical protein
MRRSITTVILGIAALLILAAGVGAAANLYKITSIHQIKPSVRHALTANTLSAVSTTENTGPLTAVPAGQTMVLTVECPASATEYVTGGGYQAQAGLVVTQSEEELSMPGGPYEWKLTVQNPTGGSLNAQVQVICLISR